MTITSRLATWVSSWAMTPSSSAGDSSSMMPVVAQTVAFLGERPSAKAFGIARVGDGDLRLGQVGLHAQALDHRVQLRRLLRRDDAGAHRGQRELVGGEEGAPRARPPAIDDHEDRAAAGRARAARREHDVHGAEQEQRSRPSGSAGRCPCRKRWVWASRHEILAGVARPYQDLPPGESPAPCRNRAGLRYRSPSSARRMRLRLALLVLAWPALAALVRPARRLVRATRPRADPEEDRSQPVADRRPQGQGAGADDRHLQPDRSASTTLQSRHHALSRAASRSCRRPRRQARGARRASSASCGRSALGSRGCGPACRVRPPHARRAAASSSTRPTSPTSSRVVLESDGFADLLDAHGVHGAHLPPGREDHGHRRRRQGRRDGDREAAGQAREGRRKVAKADRAASATRSPTVARRARRPPRPHRRPRARQERARWRARATAATSSRTTSPSLHAQQAKIQAKLAGCSGGAAPRRRPDQARLRRPDLARQRPDHLAVLRVARVGVLPPGHRHRRPGGTPIRAAAAGKVVLMQPEAASGGYGNFTCIQHTGVAVHLLRAPVALRRPRWARSVSQGQVIGYVGLHRPLLRGPPPLRDPDQRLRREPA